MRLITIHAPENAGLKLKDLAFSLDIKDVTISRKTSYSKTSQEEKDVVDITTSTPLANKFLEAMMTSAFYNPDTYSFNVRHPLSVFASQPVIDIVHPVIIPASDVYQELWQFSKITISLIVRVFLAAVLLSYGLLKENYPVLIAGLLFLPFNPTLLSIAFGTKIQEWRLAKNGFLAMLISLLLIYFAGIIVGLSAEGPVQYDKFSTPLSGVIFAVVIGVAAALGTLDDAGRKELIGLAAASHITIYPAWFGLQTVYGFTDKAETMDHLLTFALNLFFVVLSSAITYHLAGMKGDGIKKFVKAHRK